MSKKVSTIAEKSVCRIDKLVPGGQALGILADGKKAFVWNALPGELVEIEIQRSKKTWCEGVATRILEASAQRVEPQDKCYLATSPWQVFDYGYELAQKAELVAECFRQQGMELQVPITLTDGRDYEYRNKMEYSLYWDNDKAQISLAFHRRGSHGKIPVAQSSLERPEIFVRATEMVTELNANGAQARDYRALMARCNQSGEVVAELFRKNQPHPVMTALHDTLLGHEYSYSPNGFFQINLPVYEMALTKMRNLVRTERVLDLYSGVGTIGLSVARERDLTLVEVDKSAYAELERNAAGTNAQTVLAKSEEVLDFIRGDETVILDPPRAGCDTKLIERLSVMRPPMIIYLSCNPVTQARDVAALLMNDYKITHIQPYNFFPHTTHIENLIVLE